MRGTACERRGVNSFYRNRTRREKIEIKTGSVMRITKGASAIPVTTTIASGFCT